MNKETNAKLNDLAKRTRAVLKELTALDREADLYDIFPRSIIEQEIDLEQALEALSTSATAISCLTDLDQRDLSHYGTETLD
jgi:hypothetical protein